MSFCMKRNFLLCFVCNVHALIYSNLMCGFEIEDRCSGFCKVHSYQNTWCRILISYCHENLRPVSNKSVVTTCCFCLLEEVCRFHAVQADHGLQLDRSANSYSLILWDISAVLSKSCIRYTFLRLDWWFILHCFLLLHSRESLNFVVYMYIQVRPDTPHNSADG